MREIIRHRRIDTIVRKELQYTPPSLSFETMNCIKFLKPIERMVRMTNGHIRVFFDNDGEESELIVMFSEKRGLVLPRRKRAEARRKGLIK